MDESRRGHTTAHLLRRILTTGTGTISSSSSSTRIVRLQQLQADALKSGKTRVVRERPTTAIGRGVMVRAGFGIEPMGGSEEEGRRQALLWPHLPQT